MLLRKGSGIGGSDLRAAAARSARGVGSSRAWAASRSVTTPAGWPRKLIRAAPACNAAR
ncbi:MAG: hypothetical protein V9G98_03840 [Candidatus Competibacter sp.]